MKRWEGGSDGSSGALATCGDPGSGAESRRAAAGRDVSGGAELGEGIGRALGFAGLSAPLWAHAGWWWQGGPWHLGPIP